MFFILGLPNPTAVLALVVSGVVSHRALVALGHTVPPVDPLPPELRASGTAVLGLCV